MFYIPVTTFIILICTSALAILYGHKGLRIKNYLMINKATTLVSTNIALCAFWFFFSYFEKSFSFMLGSVLIINAFILTYLQLKLKKLFHLQSHALEN
jgi:hypothetical protein